MPRVSGTEVEEAKRVLRQAYYADLVSPIAAEVIERYYDGEFDDQEGLNEKLNESTDSALTYTADQWDTLYSSERSSDALEELNDMGYTDVREIMGPWAVTTLRIDVQELLADHALLTPLNDEADAIARLDWLAHEYGRPLFVKGKNTYYLVGIPNAGEHAEVNLGVVELGSDEAKLMSLYSALKIAGVKAPNELLQAVARHRESEEAFLVLVDLLLQQGLKAGPELETA